MSKTQTALIAKLPDLRGLWIALLSTSLVFIVKLYVGLTTGSYALITDSAHIFIDCSSLIVALVSLTISNNLQKSNSLTNKREYSIAMKQLLSAKINTILLFVFSFWILFEMFIHLGESHLHSEHFSEGGHSLILFAAIFGIFAHVTSAFLMRNTSNLATRGAYIHLIADIMSSLSIVVGTLIMMVIEIEWLDKALSSIIVIFLLYNAQKLYRSTIRKEKEIKQQYEHIHQTS